MTLETVDDFRQADEIVLFGINTGFEQIDAVVAFGPPATLFLWFFSSGTSLLVSIPAIVITGVVSITFVLATPGYMTISQYVKAIKHSVRHKGGVANTESEVTPEVIAEGFDRVKVDETTRDVTGVEKFYPEGNVVERTDGCHVAGLRLYPPNRDFDTRDEYIHVASQIREQLNNNVDFYFELYVTTRPFPIEEYVSELESRLDDQDIQQRDIMDKLIQNLVEDRPKELRERGTKLPHYYLITYADPDEISIEKQGTTSPLERLADVPYIGAFAEIAASIRDDAEALEKESRVLGKVQDRVAQLDASVVRPTEDIDAEVVTTLEWSELLRTFWNGDENANKTVRQQPAVRGAADIPGITADINPRQKVDAKAIRHIPLEEMQHTDAETRTEATGD
ncbi:hypothetical protein [Haloarcula marismortui]|uniref:hypothetical protein n=1 Tax=Haloarcula marismortui TaxID=2238 RepID=UPI0003254D69|nr:hypothetical protein [Haloarcula californiae]